MKRKMIKFSIPKLRMELGDGNKLLSMSDLSRLTGREKQYLYNKQNLGLIPLDLFIQFTTLALVKNRNEKLFQELKNIACVNEKDVLKAVQQNKKPTIN